MNKYKTEKEFLENYNVKDFEQLSMTTDILLLSVSLEEQENYRKISEKIMSVLLVKREYFPFKDKWCLPGGFINPSKETLEECAKRILKKETNLENIFLEQLYTFDSLNRDPRTRVVSTSYMALVDKNRLENQITENASWFNIVDIIENKREIEIILDNKEEKISFKIKKKLKEQTTDRYEFITAENNFLAFDHDIVILSGLERLKNKVGYTDIVFHMMPKYFTLKELQQVYEVILQKKLLDPAFRRIIKDKVEKTNKMKRGEGHRPSALFKYKNDKEN